MNIISPYWDPHCCAAIFNNTPRSAPRLLFASHKTSLETESVSQHPLERRRTKCWILRVILQGWLEFHLPGRAEDVVRVNAGQAILFHPGEYAIREYAHNLGQLQSMVLVFDRWKPRNQAYLSPKTGAIILPNSQAFCEPIRWIISAGTRSKPEAEYSIFWHVQSFLNLVMSIIENSLMDPSNQNGLLLDNSLNHADTISRAHNWILSTPPSLLNAQHLAEYVNMRPQSLSRKYREMRGRTPQEDLIRQRLQAAEYAIASGINIESVASGYGFSDSRHFRHMQKKYR